MISLRPLPLFLGIWSCAAVGVTVGALFADWVLGGRYNIVSMLGISLTVAAGGTTGVLRRRRRSRPLSEAAAAVVCEGDGHRK